VKAPDLENKRILLTGASGGIGRAIAARLAASGASLVLVGRNAAKLEQLQQVLPGNHYCIEADINSADGRDTVVALSRKTGTEVLINAAGVMDFQFYDRQGEEAVERMITTNLLSPMLLCQQLIPLLKQRPEAAIVNIGSIFGSIGHPGFTAYCASKFGLRGFTEALQRELADTSVEVFYLAPRATRTSLNSDAVSSLNEALGNTTDSPEQVAEELLRVLSGKRTQSFMGWPEKFFVRLNGLFPGLVHNALVKKLPIIRQHAGI
jgi:short-subunit dehydrogenase